ncbi:MAG: PLP-dependent cysteine synthase family protein [Conexivisphaera sp.]
MRFELVDAAAVRSPVRPDLEEVLGEYSKLVGSGRVWEPLIVHESTGILLRGFALREALDLLAAERFPALLVEDGEFSVRGEDPVRAASEGRTLDEGSFAVSLVGAEIPRVDVPLGELTSGPRPVGRRVYRNTLELLVNDWPTPLVRLNACSSADREVWAKLEWYNPFSLSVKDRVAWAMMVDAAERGCLGDRVYEATSTNTGLALAALSNVMGSSCRIYLPSSATEGVDPYFDVMGAALVRGSEHLTVQMLGKVLADAARDGATVLNQFENDANFKVHLKHTARELREQLEAAGRRPDYVVGALGTSGHMSAISFHFKAALGDAVRTIGVQPAPGSTIPGMRRIETGMKWLRLARLDHIVDVTPEEAVEGVKGVARSDGILVGPSSGAVIAAVRKLDLRGTVAVVMPDSGLKYRDFLRSMIARSGARSTLAAGLQL